MYIEIVSAFYILIAPVNIHHEIRRVYTALPKHHKLLFLLPYLDDYLTLQQTISIDTLTYILLNIYFF